MGILLSDAQLNVYDSNNQASGITGFSKDELLSFQALDIIHPDSEKELSVQKMVDLSRAEGGITYERLYNTKVGPPVPVEVHLFVNTESGHHLIMFQDITERKAAQRALLESEESLATIIRAAPVGIGWVRNRQLLSVNKQLCEIVGYEPDELNGAETSILYASDEEFKRVGRMIYSQVRQGGTGSCEAQLKRKDGRLVDALFNAAATTADHDEMDLVFTVQDITDKKEREETYQQLFDQANDAILLLDADTASFVECNNKALELFNVPRERLIGSTPMDFTAKTQPDGAPTINVAMPRVQAAAAGDPQHFEWRHIRGDGSEIDVDVGLGPLRKEGRNFVMAIIRDISDRKKAEEELQRHHNHLEDLVDKRTEELSATVIELKRRHQETDLLTRLGDLLNACETGPESYSIMASICSQLFQGDSGFVGIQEEGSGFIVGMAGFGGFDHTDQEFELSHCWALRRGKTHTVSDSAVDPICPHLDANNNPSSLCIPLGARGETMGLLHLRLDSCQDIPADECDRLARNKSTLAERVAELYSLSLSNILLRGKLQEQSIIDPLTQLYNRKHMEAVLTREIDRVKRRGAHVCLALMDVDFFKQFNDTYGHDAGDAVLRSLGAFLNDSTRGEDVACRYGGEELLVIFPDCPSNDCQDRAEQIRNGVEALVVQHKDKGLKVTVSIGVASYPDNGLTGEALITTADAALYKAKENGRNRVETA